MRIIRRPHALLKPQAAADEAGLSVYLLNKAYDAGKLEFRTVGSRRYTSLTFILDYLSSQNTGGTE